jgi:NADP-dependent 3-hydroxy acid dehydrogenase YdfG
MSTLQGKVVWISGAGTGIGRAVARLFAAQGACLVLTGRRADKLKGVYAEVVAAGGRGEVLALDVCRREWVEAAAAALLKRYGRVDVLVNNAGMNVRGRKLDVLSGEDWDQVVQTNLTGAFNMIHAVLPAMRRQQDGLIVNISSMAAKRVSGIAGTAYTASKHGMNGLSLSVSAEEGANGIRCTALMPGVVNTEILEKRAVSYSAEERARMIQPEDIAQAVHFLALLPRRSTVPEMQLVPTLPRAPKPGENMLEPAQQQVRKGAAAGGARA